MTEDEMVAWHHGLDEHEFEQAQGVGDGQGILAYLPLNNYLPYSYLQPYSYLHGKTQSAFPYSS